MNERQKRLLGILKNEGLAPLQKGNRHGERPFATGFSPFQIKVLKAVCQIPPGQTRSYKWVAKKVGKPNASRAVGQVLKKNPFPLIVPCHRVIRSDGSLGGFSKGSEAKKALLQTERNVIIGRHKSKHRLHRF